MKGDPPIFSICQKGPLKIAQLLLQVGADLSLTNKNNDNAIILCCRNGQPEILELLLTAADFDTIR